MVVKSVWHLDTEKYFLSGIEGRRHEKTAKGDGQSWGQGGSLYRTVDKCEKCHIDPPHFS